MPASVSPRLLATYLATAVRNASEGRALSERSDWAVKHALRQLEGDRDVLLRRRAVSPASSPALVNEADVTVDPSLTVQVVRRVSSGQDGLRGREAAEHLEEVIRGLHALREGSVDRETAELLSLAFPSP